VKGGRGESSTKRHTNNRDLSVKKGGENRRKRGWEDSESRMGRKKDSE